MDSHPPYTLCTHPLSYKSMSSNSGRRRVSSSRSSSRVRTTRSMKLHRVVMQNTELVTPSSSISEQSLSDLSELDSEGSKRKRNRSKSCIVDEELSPSSSMVKKWMMMKNRMTKTTKEREMRLRKTEMNHHPMAMRKMDCHRGCP